MSSLNFQGTIPATVLPLTADFEPDLKTLERHLDWVIGQHAVGLAINVDTGEGPHLSDVIFAPPVPDYCARTKEALVMQGVLPNAYVRPPLLPISEKERDRIRQAMERAGQLEDIHVG